MVHTRNNRRHQRGGVLSCSNVADMVIYPYMHDHPLPPYEASLQYNTREIKLFVANNIQKIRDFMCTPPPNYTIFSVTGKQTIANFGKYLYERCEKLFSSQSESIEKGIKLESLPSGWIKAGDQYVNIFTNEEQRAKPTKEATDELWSLSRKVSPKPQGTSVRPTLTADKTNIIEGETVTITPTYGKSATLMVTICNPPMIANSDINEKAENVKNGLTSEYSGKTFAYEGLPSGTYVLQLIGDDSSKSEPLTITVEPKSSGKGGKTRGHKRRASKRTRKH